MLVMLEILDALELQEHHPIPPRLQGVFSSTMV